MHEYKLIIFSQNLDKKITFSCLFRTIRKVGVSLQMRRTKNSNGNEPLLQGEEI